MTHKRSVSQNQFSFSWIFNTQKLAAHSQRNPYSLPHFRIGERGATAPHTSFRHVFTQIILVRIQLNATKCTVNATRVALLIFFLNTVPVTNFQIYFLEQDMVCTDFSIKFWKTFIPQEKVNVTFNLHDSKLTISYFFVGCVEVL